MPNKKQAYILALETSADETSAAVLRGELTSGQGRLLSNIVYSQIAVHKKTGGIVPEVAARAHLPKILPTVREALNKAELSLPNIDAVAVTTGPGLITSLMVGVDTAKSMAYALNKPVIPTNHLEGHLLSGFAELPKSQTTNFEKFFPALGLIVSGGHTLLVFVEKIGKYKILGETLDDAAGEAFDKIAKLLGLPYPGGPHLSKLAESGDPAKYDFPRPLLNQKNCNFSFSGLKTAVLYFLRDNPEADRPGVAASTEQAIIDVLVAKTLRAARENSAKTILLGGGVAANKKLRLTLKKGISKSLPSSRCLIPNFSLATDNAGMIAYAAWQHYLFGRVMDYSKAKANPNFALTSWR